MPVPASPRRHLRSARLRQLVCSSTCTRDWRGIFGPPVANPPSAMLRQETDRSQGDKIEKAKQSRCAAFTQPSHRMGVGEAEGNAPLWLWRLLRRPRSPACRPCTRRARTNVLTCESLLKVFKIIIKAWAVTPGLVCGEVFADATWSKQALRSVRTWICPRPCALRVMRDAYYSRRGHGAMRMARPAGVRPGASPLHGK